MSGSTADKGFSYAVSDEALREHRKLSPWQKLRWLLEANLFIAKFAPDRVKRLHDRFRAGEI